MKLRCVFVAREARRTSWVIHHRGGLRRVELSAERICFCLSYLLSTGVSASVPWRCVSMFCAVRGSALLAFQFVAVYETVCSVVIVDVAFACLLLLVRLFGVPVCVYL